MATLEPVFVAAAVPCQGSAFRHHAVQPVSHLHLLVRIKEDESDAIRVYDDAMPEEIVSLLYDNSVIVSEIKKAKVGLEEYYTDLMAEREERRA